MAEPVEHEDAAMIMGDANTELASSRTALAFQRTEFASDRNLMAIIRTALALIVFGFTIYQAFKEFLTDRLPPQGPARFGLSLIILGVVLLALGIRNHWKAVRRLRGYTN